ncbi:MAG TPA: hypothetical protein VF756_21445 [Thermoanaerobaculia bacterium]
MKRTVFGLLLGITLLLATAPVLAQDLGLRRWGPRAGVADNPDQIVLGAQADFGEFIPRLRFQPDVELGLGDDHTILSLSAPVHYLLPLEGNFTLYGGGGIMVGWIDEDENARRRVDEDGSEIDISPMLAGGVEWPVGRQRILVELKAAGGEQQDLKLMVGWMF